MTRPRGYSIELTVHREVGEHEVDWDALVIRRERYPRGVAVGPHVAFDSCAEYMGPCRCEACLEFKRAAHERRAAARFFPQRAELEATAHEFLLDDVLGLQEPEDG